MLLRNTQLEKRLSINEMEEAMKRFNSWRIAGRKPARSRPASRSATKAGLSPVRTHQNPGGWPFPEAKEAVGGYILIQAESLEEAVKIASEWPLLAYDAFVEVRPVVNQCATMQLLSDRLESPERAQPGRVHAVTGSSGCCRNCVYRVMENPLPFCSPGGTLEISRWRKPPETTPQRASAPAGAVEHPSNE